ELPCMDGSGARLALGAPTGLPTVVNLWASWCGPCAKEMPAFVAFAARATGKARVVGVNTGDDPENAVAAAKDVRVTFANVYDPEQRVRRALAVPGLPATVFVTADGRVVHVYNGPALDQPTLELLVEKHLGVVLP
ncbi:MAG TPA: TlpA disulfide reductase family protein, partial [Cryptosporangiaceae bacterium]|nr:TlpA disulfide reductase family protein [Cryptosporangiaceae bacterium]